MRAISVIGYSKSGKTHLIERIIQQLTNQGYKVASAKKIHVEDFTIDTPGKDSWRHWRAGAQHVAVIAPEETSVIFHNVNLTLWEFSKFFSADLIILEGFRQSSVPKILCGKTEEDLTDELLNHELIICISGRIAENLRKDHKLPVLSPNKDIEQIIDLIIKKAGPILPDLSNCQECNKTCEKLAVDILLGKDSVETCKVFQREKINRNH